MDKDKPVLLVLGSPHLDNPGRDYINLEVDDVLQPRRQQEIEEIVRRLRLFQPTKIAVEVPLEKESNLNADYTRYVQGQFELPSDEVYQVGFRLARSLGHAKVYAVDSFDDPPSGLDTDFESFAGEHSQRHFIEQALCACRTSCAEEARILANGSLSDLYIAMNRPEVLRDDHRVYFSLARIGDGPRYPGANWVQQWYGRNLRIWVNLTRISQPNDRVLSIIGAGHAWLLRQFASESGLYELDDPLVYLQPIGLDHCSC
ncbi:DUF5694 domain-containing protein [Candidatus Acetothermia bacterium]|jgi:hypothetical protein|nr:DUF5694 domain-containing protein [Candidatus Acetothermia bacterium]